MLDFPTEVIRTESEPQPRQHFIDEVLKDFWTCLVSREVSLLGRKEVLSGKGKFGVFGDGKEVPQVALSRVFRKGDHRAGYYRDQTIMFALGIAKIEDFFAQMYTDARNDPFSAGRQMNAHFATPYIDEEGEFTNHMELFNQTSDISCTAGQMARAVGLALASNKYKELKSLFGKKHKFSRKGKEVCFCTIGDASCAEGPFWEAVNAAATIQIPLVISVWDDGYGISVPVDKQIAKASISDALQGMQTEKSKKGLEIYKVEAWNYPKLVATYEKAIKKARKNQSPALIHVIECTQPQGHSTSGSHERYKSKQRLSWERDWDCIDRMESWMISSGICDKETTKKMKARAKEFVRERKTFAWKRYITPINEERELVINLISRIGQQAHLKKEILEIKKELDNLVDPTYSEVVQLAKRALYLSMFEKVDEVAKLKAYIDGKDEAANLTYHTKLYSDTPKAAVKVPVVEMEFEGEEVMAPGYKVINTFFDKAFAKHKELLAFGEDVGKIGDVNQGMAGLQEKYGEERVFDVGIREWTIVGQAIGLAMRGFKPIMEIQYLDYLYYGLAPLADDVASLRYRSNGLQSVPLIVRTRGHRLEGIWHSGSPIGMIINSLRGMYLAVPRNLTQAAGFYNTLIQGDDPAIVIETLNGYRKREVVPSNIGEYTIPLGVPEILLEGTDVTVVSYGACIAEIEEAIPLLNQYDISIELIDVRTLLPFDLEGVIVNSLKKTSRLIVIDEDVPGGASAYIVNQVLEEQDGYYSLDSKPITLTAQAHRPPYGSDGDYYTKPNPEQIFETIYTLMTEVDPDAYPIAF
ncbi:alpha-ketoacid dehydrogenase subunit alpha/beta [Portibacter lacus]|uniref:3-methyl-2-oxobutanoate dehydrogenase (2-methylpropanoyl-transferring) n=1 Tax=Portibacter lacus TaxID=1099794 RepID=A0AA37WC45_9BACT|nr:alpha-ketoacid dehydrogenase subunit alpha/beta [Portibacter lacus]GLR15778.1 transketolase [Portibacter lacus]